jgi:hypothetical protein
LKDPDIEKFLKNQAIRYGKVSKSRTYLLFDENSFSEKRYVLIGYFTLALQVFKIGDLNLSNSKIKEFDGISAKKYGEKITDLSVYLIGQLAKNHKYADTYNGKDVLESALSEILKSQEFVGGRLVLVESKNEPKLTEFYLDNGFTLIQQDTDKLLQFLRVIG